MGGQIANTVSDVPQSFFDIAHQATKPFPMLTDDGPARMLSTTCYTGDGHFEEALHGWRRKSFGEKRQCKSHGNLRLLIGHGSGSTSDCPNEDITVKGSEAQHTKTVGLGAMPFEILDLIFSYLIEDISPDTYGPRNLDLISCLTVSRTLHAVALTILYRNVTIPHSRTFSKLMTAIRRYPALGMHVWRLDFSHYTSIGFGRSRQASSEIQNVTPQTLQECVDLMTKLKEFQVHEHVDDELNGKVLHKLFSALSLRALDLTACSSKIFVESFTRVVINDQDSSNPLPFLKRLCLHECSTLQAPVFGSLLPRLHNLTHLDVAHTLITDSALSSIPHTARLTHLNVSRCTRITGPSTVKFLATHNAVKDSLVYLNLMADASRHRLLSAKDVQKLIPCLPSTLRSLNLGGAMITNEHLTQLLPLTKHLEELGLRQAHLSIADINSLFVPKTANLDNEWSFSDDEENWVSSSIRYLDLTEVPAVTRMSLFDSFSVLVSPYSFPLEVIELGDEVMRSLRQSSNSTNQLGWVVKELGRRGWFVRMPIAEGADDGRREWKMGARWWGMRKVPVAVQEVGGMYGHYMFKN